MNTPINMTRLQGTYLGRFKLWAHYTLFHKWVSPFLPGSIRRFLYLRSRRWLYGQNVNNEDLIELLKRATGRVKDL